MVFRVQKQRIFLYPFIGLRYVIHSFFKPIYNLSRYFFFGIEYMLYIFIDFIKYVGIGVLFLSIIVFRIFHYAFFALKIPFILLNNKNVQKNKVKNEEKFEPKKEIKNVIENNSENNNVIDFTSVVDNKENIQEKDPFSFDSLFYDYVKRKNDERNNLLEAKEKEEELKNDARAKALKRKKLDSEDYINENVILERPTIKQKFKNFFASFIAIFTGIGDKFRNNTFSKNRRNRKDIKHQALLIDFEGEDAVKSEKKVLYQYVAKDKNGKIVKDYFTAYSKVEVHSYLLSEGYEVYSIKTNKWIQLMHAGSNTNKSKFKNKDLIFFLTQLSTYLKAGIPLVEALRIISRQFKKKSYQKIFRAVIYELTIGESFSSAMDKQNVAFPKLLINMVKTAEMTGSLPEVLDDMANYYTEAEATRKQMITAMTYPAIVFVFSIGVMIFVMIYVVPRFVEIYNTMDTGIPGITKAILGISSFLKNYWYLVIIGVGLLIFIFVMSYKKIKGFRAICQYVIMHIPIFKNVVIYNEVTMFTKTFSSLLAHNVPITDCMEILNKITNNEIYKMLILDTLANLARGGKISDAFKDNWAFPLPAYEMIVTGEATGELAEMMGKVSSYYQDLHKNAVARIKTFVEPALTIFLTVGVGVILLSIIVPMFGMYSAVQDME